MCGIAGYTGPVRPGRIEAMTAAMTHHQDVGGMTPGSVPTNATEIFQEGLRIPPLKLRDKGKINETLVAIIRQNVRIPDTVMGDIHAQLAACLIGVAPVARRAFAALRLGQRQQQCRFRLAAQGFWCITCRKQLIT